MNNYLVFVLCLAIVLGLYGGLEHAKEQAEINREDQLALFEQYNVNVSNGDILYRCSDGHYYVYRPDSILDMRCGRLVKTVPDRVSLYYEYVVSG